MIPVSTPRTRSITRIAALFALIAFASGVAVIAGPVAGQTNLGEPELEVYLPNDEVAPGTETTFDLRLQNDAYVGTGSATPTITTARAVSVNITDPGPFDVQTGETPVGQIADGAAQTAEFAVVVPEDVEPGTYDVDVRVRYSVTNRESSSGEQRLRRSTRETFEVRVTDDAIFVIENATTDAQPGTTGEAEIEVANVGSATAYRTTATFTGGGGVTIDGGESEAFLGDVSPGERRIVGVDVELAEAMLAGEKPIDAAFEYEDENGIERGEARTATGSLAPVAEQSFSISEFDDTLSVGYDGRITGSVRNDGPATIADGVLVIEPASDSLTIEERRIALPSLEPGEATDFEYPTEVSGQADPGARQVDFTLEYSNGGRATTTVGPVSERVVVDDRGYAFAVDGEGVSVTQGSTGELTLSITNERPETLRNINAKLYADSPLSTSSDEAFVAELEPGESSEIRFDIAAEGSAMPKTQRVELDFQYDTERGETVLSRTYQHPVEIREQVDDGDDGPSPLLIGGVLVAIAAIVGVVWWRRRD